MHKCRVCLTFFLLHMCRDAEVLSLFAAIINKLKERMAKEVPTIFEAVFQVTLQMITKNFEVCKIPNLSSCKLLCLCMTSIMVFAKPVLVGGDGDWVGGGGPRKQEHVQQ